MMSQGSGSLGLIDPPGPPNSMVNQPCTRDELDRNLLLFEVMLMRKKGISCGLVLGLASRSLYLP